MRNRFEALLHHRYTPLLLLAATGILCYGFFVTQTGFYWDDLPMSWIRYELGPESMAQYFSNNRPVWGWLYQLTTRLLPQVPVFWQLFALFWRWVGAVLVWGICRELWRERAGFATGAALLFLVYPGFNAQWTAYLYSHFFIVLAIFLFSLYCMLIGLRRRGWSWLAAGLIASALNLWMMEYFFVLELARGAVLWIALRQDSRSAPERWSRTWRAWWPYLALFAAAVLSRLFIFNNQVYGFGLLPRLQQDLAGTLLGLLQNALVSFWTVAAAAWLQVARFPDPAQYGPKTLAIYAGVLLAVLLMVLAWGWSQRAANERPATGRQAWWMVGLGLVMLPFASAPFWLIDLPVTLAFPANRFTLPSMLPASLIVMGLLELIPSMRLRLGLLAVLVALAAGRQTLWGVDFSRDWQTQKNLFWQMFWRAPGLQPGTMVLMNEGALEFYADNSLSAALNWIYAPRLKATSEIPYLLLYPTNRLEGTLSSLQAGQNVSYNYLAGEFSGSTSQVVAFFFQPPACLRLLDADIDSGNRLIAGESMMREAAQLSSAQWITPQASARMPDVYGPEPEHGWCYYFEQADLARQLGDWQKVAELGDQAFALDDYPNDPAERFVFIEGYAHTGRWDKAVEYSLQSHRVSPAYVDSMLCKLWQRIQAQTQSGEARGTALEQVKMKLACSDE